MSAYKTAYIRLGDAEYQRLRHAEEQLRLRALFPEADMLENECAAGLSIFDRMVGKKAAQKTGEHSAQPAKKTQDAYAPGVTATHGENRRRQHGVHAVEQALEDRAVRQYDPLAEQLAKELEAARVALAAQRSEQEERVQHLENRWQEYAEQASAWIDQGLNLLEDLYARFTVDSELANQLEYQRSTIHQAIEQYNQQRFDLAAEIAFQALSALTLDQVRLESEQNRQSAAYNILLKLTAQLVDEMRRSWRVAAMDGEGNALPEQIEVDYWVEGRYQVLADQVNRLYEQVIAHPNLDMQAIMQGESQVNTLEGDRIDLVTEARMAALASQMRFNVAQIVVKSLESQGFFLENASYQQGDYRDSFVAKTCNLAGNEVVVTIDPDVGLDEGGRLGIQSLDAATITEHELIQRNSEIFQALHENGIAFGEIVTSPSPTKPFLDRTNRRRRPGDGMQVPKEENLYGRR